MDVVMEYDPYDCRTRITIDGDEPESCSQPFAQIERFPLQVWLGRRLDWPGLAERLRALSRGTHISLRFIGRAIDYADVEAGLADGKLDIALEHAPKYEEQDGRMGGGAEAVAQLFGSFPARAGNARDEAIARTAASCRQTLRQGDITVKDEGDLRQSRDAIRQTCRPLFIDEAVFRQFGGEIEGGIARDFTRPFESVYIVVADAQHAQAFRAQRERGMLVGTGRDEAAERMRRKYARVGASKLRANGAAELKRLIEQIEAEYDSVQCESEALKRRLLHEATMKPGEEERLKQLGAWIRWCEKARPTLQALVADN